jgi:hypothetical protein
MASNTLPTNSGLLIGLAENMISGINAIGAQVPVTMVTVANMQSALDAFIAADGAFNAARSARQSASDAYQAAIGALYPWLLSVSNVLASYFGTRWNTQWAQAGFINNSTAIPAKAGDQIGLALSLVGFFTANPSYEVASMGLTAAQGTTLRSAVVTAQGALTAAMAALSTIGNTWTTAYDALTALMRALLKNLEGLLAKDDPRWLIFGLQMPATISTPGQPQNLSAHLDGTGAIIVQCDPVALATRYRWRMLRVGIDADYSLAASSKEPIGSITGVLPGQTARIIAQAINGSLQGVASDPILFTVPLTSSAAATVVSHSALSSNGNGNGNGHHHAPAAEVKTLLHPRMA